MFALFAPLEPAVQSGHIGNGAVVELPHHLFLGLSPHRVERTGLSIVAFFKTHDAVGKRRLFEVVERADDFQ